MQGNDAMRMKLVHLHSSFPLQHIRAQASHQPRVGIKMSGKKKYKIKSEMRTLPSEMQSFLFRDLTLTKSGRHYTF